MDMVPPMMLLESTAVPRQPPVVNTNDTLPPTPATLIPTTAVPSIATVPPFGGGQRDQHPNALNLNANPSSVTSSSITTTTLFSSSKFQTNLAQTEASLSHAQTNLTETKANLTISKIKLAKLQADDNHFIVLSDSSPPPPSVLLLPHPGTRQFGLILIQCTRRIGTHFIGCTVLLCYVCRVSARWSGLSEMH